MDRTLSRNMGYAAGWAEEFHVVKLRARTIVGLRGRAVALRPPGKLGTAERRGHLAVAEAPRREAVTA